MHMQLKPGRAYTPSSGYTTDAEYFVDLTAIYRREFQTLYDAGLRNIQIDDPQLSFFSDEEFLCRCHADGQDPDKLLDLYANVYIDCFRQKPADLHVGVHLCRGNARQGLYFSSGSYDKIAKRLFNDLPFDTFYLEYDTKRAGSFEPLRFLSRNENIVLGIVST